MDIPKRCWLRAQLVPLLVVDRLLSPNVIHQSCRTRVTTEVSEVDVVDVIMVREHV